MVIIDCYLNVAWVVSLGVSIHACFCWWISGKCFCCLVSSNQTLTKEISEVKLTDVTVVNSCWQDVAWLLGFECSYKSWEVSSMSFAYSMLRLWRHSLLEMNVKHGILIDEWMLLCQVLLGSLNKITLQIYRPCRLLESRVDVHFQ